MSLLLQVLVSGLAAGAVYGLVAVALVLVYRLTGIVYFAFGDLVGLAVFAALLVAAGTGPVTQTSVGAGRFLVAVAVGPGLHRDERRGVLACRPPPPRARLGRRLDRGDGGDRLRRPHVDRRVLHAAELRLPRSAAVRRRRQRRLRHRRRRVDPGSRPSSSPSGLPSHSWPAGPPTFEARPGPPRDRVGRRGRRASRRAGHAPDRNRFGLVGGLAGLAAVVAAPSASFGVESGSLLGVKALLAALVVGFSSPIAGFLAGLGVGVVEAGIANFHLAGFELGRRTTRSCRSRSSSSTWRCARSRPTAGPRCARRDGRVAVLGQTRRAVVDAARDARAAWSARTTAIAGMVLLAALCPSLRSASASIAGERPLSRGCCGGPRDRRRARRDAFSRSGRVHRSRRVRDGGAGDEGRLAHRGRRAGGSRPGRARRRWSGPWRAVCVRRWWRCSPGSWPGSSR